MNDDVIVYAHPDGRSYVAIIGEDWYRWPAVGLGWQQRARCPASLAEECSELPPRLAHLALMMSGVTTGAVDALRDIHQRE